MFIRLIKIIPILFLGACASDGSVGTKKLGDSVFGGGTFKTITEEKTQVVAAQNLEEALEVADDAINWTVVPGSIEVYDDGGIYSEQTGVTSSGKSIALEQYFYPTTGEQGVSSNIARMNDNVAFIISGDKVVNFPTGTFTYSGDAWIRTLDAIKQTYSSEDEYGSFTAIANFTTKNIIIAANTDNMFFSTNNGKINLSDGTFESMDGLIGTLKGEELAATVTGIFAGTNAEAVGGLAYSDLNSNEIYFADFASVTK